MPGFSLCAVKAALLRSCVGSFRVSLLDWNMIGRDHPKYLVFPLCHSPSQDLFFFFSFSCVPHSAATTTRMLDIPRAGAKYGNLMQARLLLKMFASGVCLQTPRCTLLLVRKEEKKGQKGFKAEKRSQTKVSQIKSNQIVFAQHFFYTKCNAKCFKY